MPPALSTADMGVLRWRAAEARYLPGRYTGSGDPDSTHTRTGRVPVLLSAGHAVAHPRDGVRKAADMGTGGLVDALADLTGCHALTVDGPPSRDPNYDPDGTVKDALAALRPRLRAALDVHGMTDSWGVDVCLGRGPYPPRADALVAVLRDRLTAAGFTVGVDVPFDARHRHTLTAAHQAAGLPAVQVELARRLRNPWDAPETARAVLDALAAAVADIAAAGDRPAAPSYDALETIATPHDQN